MCVQHRANGRFTIITNDDVIGEGRGGGGGGRGGVGGEGEGEGEGGGGVKH